MLKENLRFLIIFVSLLITITGPLFLFSRTDLTRHYIVKSYTIDKLSEISTKYIKDLLEHPAIIYFTILYLSILFFMNTIHLKITLTFWKGFLFIIFWSFALTALFTGFLPISRDSTVKQSSQHFLDEVYSSSRVLNINGTTLFYSLYAKEKNVFRNLLVASKDRNIPLYYSPEAISDKSKRQIKLNNVKVMGQNESSPKEMPVSLDMSQFLKRMYVDKLSLDHSRKLRDMIQKTFRYVPLTPYQEHLTSQTKGIYNFVTHENVSMDSWKTVLNFFIEILGTILIFGSIGIVLTTRSLPLINLLTSTIAGFLLIFGLIHYHFNSQSIIEPLTTTFSFLPTELISGSLFMLMALPVFLLAFLRYKKIHLLPQGKGKG
ncbi:MAG: hypothetical protein IEMM0008_0955 [bacterium]|nr:MAG: hypothetical protein IEMM0008_0955 [bacterium]